MLRMGIHWGNQRPTPRKDPRGWCRGGLWSRGGRVRDQDPQGGRVLGGKAKQRPGMGSPASSEPASGPKTTRDLAWWCWGGVGAGPTLCGHLWEGDGLLGYCPSVFWTHPSEGPAPPTAHIGTSGGALAFRMGALLSGPCRGRGSGLPAGLTPHLWPPPLTPDMQEHPQMDRLPVQQRPEQSKLNPWRKQAPPL